MEAKEKQVQEGGGAKVDRGGTEGQAYREAEDLKTMVEQQSTRAVQQSVKSVVLVFGAETVESGARLELAAREELVVSGDREQ